MSFIFHGSVKNANLVRAQQTDQNIVKVRINFEFCIELFLLNTSLSIFQNNQNLLIIEIEYFPIIYR